MEIAVASEKEREEIFNQYANLRPVWESDDNTYMLTAKELNSMVAYLFVVRHPIKAPVGGAKEDFISIIHSFVQKKGIGSALIQKVIEMAKQNDIYQIRAFCEIDNVASHALFYKNGFTISPFKSDDGTILGSMAAYRTK